MEERDRNYIYAEFKSRTLGFVDDVEFFLPEEQAVLHVRSASRVGYDDLGKNKRRVEWVRKQLSKES